MSWQLMGLWLLSLVLMLAWLGVAPVARTQEARVLETARQMLPRSWPDWLVPKLNDALRLQKPPLCYWMTAGAYEIGGVSEGVGRVPTVILGWLTVAVAFRFSRELFGQPTALLTAAMLVGSYLFFRHMRLAETDAPSTFFVTLAIYCIYRASRDGPIWLHYAAAAMAGALIGKGGPVVYPILFLVGFCVVEHRFDLLKRSVTGGAIITLLGLGLPWFAYVIVKQGWGVLFSEATTLASGENHFQWPWVYLPWSLISVAPWCLVLPIAVVDAIRRWKLDASARLLLIWSLAIAVPLCVIGNKQKHYVLPLTLPLLMLCGRCLAARAGDWKLLRWSLIAMIVAGAGCIPAIFWLAHQQRGHAIALDWMVAGAILIGLVVTALVQFRFGTLAGYSAFAACAALLMPLVIGDWIGGIYRFTPRQLATDLRSSYGNGPYLFFGPNVSLPLCFNLRESIDSAPTVVTLEKESLPGTIIIAQTKALGSPPPLPERFEFLRTINGAEQKIDLYRDRGP